jgi:hypothetical protein
MKQKKTIPFQFVLEALSTKDPMVKPMFGCHAVYVNGKIVLILRQKSNALKDNGVWIATSHDHHASLKKLLPCLRPITVFGENGGWQNIPEEAVDFEECVVAACELILRNDARIGKVTKAKKKV